MAVDPADIEEALGAALPAGWAGRALLVRRAEMLQLECIVRGYLAGQAYEEYERAGTVHGTAMPPGLQLASRLPEPIFTPSTKAAEGHDVNIDFAAAADLVGHDAAAAARDICLELYRRARRARPAPASCWPTRSSSWATSTACSACATRCARRTRRATGRPTRWCRDGRPRPSTSSPCATGWPRSPGTARHPRRRCPPTVTTALSERYVAAYERITRALVGRLVRCDAMRFRARVEVQLRPGIADPEGATIERALPALGFDSVQHVRAGRSFSFEVDAPDEGAARTTATELADRLLANPVIEQSRLELEAI